MEMLISPSWLQRKIESEPEENIEAGFPAETVEQKQRVWGFDSAYCDDYEWVRDEPDHETADEESIEDKIEGDYERQRLE